MRKRTTIAVVAAAMLVPLFLAGCGGSDTASSTSTANEATPASAAAAVATPVPPQVLEIRAGDYFFEPKDVSVRTGAVRVTLSNSGPERPHTWVIKTLNGGGDLARTDRIAVGGSGTIEFTVSEPGTYEVYCSLPGHADRGQRGTLTVVAS